MRIAVLGANGQVGSEVCLLLRQAGVDVVPICRNRSGSAFLRWHGLACRHGRVTEAAQARDLLGDCDVVANFALAMGRPRESRTANARLVERAAEASAPGARIAYFSTLSVHARFQAAGSPRSRSAYGVEKLRCERDARSAARRFGKPTWILRLGHVSGALQGIHDELRRLVLAGPVAVPQEGRRASNVVHTVTVADAIVRVAEGRDPPGTYDLLSVPIWTWEEVLAEEAARAGVPLRLLPADGDRRRPGLLRAAAGRLLAAPRTRELALSLIAHLPERFNLRAQSQHFRRRAAAEIGALRQRPASHGAFTFPPMEARTLPSLAPTAQLLREGRGRIPPPLCGPIGEP